MRVGFVIDGLYPSCSRLISRECRVRELFFGQPSATSIGLMRFEWISRQVNNGYRSVRYELYRPWRRYDVVVLMKSMGADIDSLASALRVSGASLIYDANVDYLTPASGTFYYKGMRPTEEQQEACTRIVKVADGVIADSEHLAGIFAAKCCSVQWVSDNVDMTMVPGTFVPSGLVDGKLHLLWSGMSSKLFDLLLIEDVLRSYQKQIRLHIITNDPAGMDCIFDPWQGRLKRLLKDLDATIEQFVSIPHLLQRYSQGGVFISPRFLDNSYNLGHTEWKITLAMACGRTVLCSSQKSYVTVAGRNQNNGVRICASLDDWSRELERLLVGEIDWMQEGESCRETVKKYYSTPVVARQHVDYLRRLQGQVDH